MVNFSDLSENPGRLLRSASGKALQGFFDFSLGLFFLFAALAVLAWRWTAGRFRRSRRRARS